MLAECVGCAVVTLVAQGRVECQGVDMESVRTGINQYEAWQTSIGQHI